MRPFAALLIIALIASCNGDKSVTVTLHEALSNYKHAEKEKQLLVDYTNAIDSGFVIPSSAQTASGYFNLSFTLSNNRNVQARYYYRIFYQNESYMFPEYLDKSISKYNPLASENFYGSWEGDSVREIILMPGEKKTITDSIRIIGNPRNEQIYFDRNTQIPLSDSEIVAEMNSIRSQAEWLSSIAEKAKKEKRPVEEQLRLDAIYMLKHAEKPVENQRWKRNPRMGLYNFYLLLIPEKQLSKIPSYVSRIDVQSGGNYINPLFYVKQCLQFGTAVKAYRFAESLRVKAIPSLGSGIYIDNNEKPCSDFYNGGCNSGYELYKKAAFTQYFHHLPENFYAPNITAVKNVQSDYTIGDYVNYSNKRNASSLIPHGTISTTCPCETVNSEPLKKSISITSPGVRRGILAKENTGVMSRHGITYGTYTFKVKMPELINRHQAWNGLTNALWLINQTNAPWNFRRNCNAAGYIPKETAGVEGAERKGALAYSEIDFEIRKGHPHWPSTSYYSYFPKPPYDGKDSGSVVVLCTNWDLACNQPKSFNAGAVPFRHDNDTFVLHRWTHYYQALSSKYMAEDDELFAGPYYYFQIEWKPESITWRIGPEKNKLRTICYMDSTVTSIPNNQMVIVFTQEYHISQWWPESPQLQEYVPLPAKNITGTILSVEIE